jgi:hypothetical protein
MKGIKSLAAALLLAAAGTLPSAAASVERYAARLLVEQGPIGTFDPHRWFKNSRVSKDAAPSLAPTTDTQRALGTRYVDSASAEAEGDLAPIWTLALLAGGLIALGIAVRRRQGK